MGKKESEQLLKSDLYPLKKVILFLYSLFGILLLSLIVTSCANKGVITGGEKDTIPPVMIGSVPFDQSLNYKGTEIILTFDERVQAPQLQRKLLITPFTDTQYKVKINKNIVQLSFEESFADSTTFTINFSDAITDVTENNPGRNVVVAFSTWDIIDSLTVFGKVLDLMSNQPIEAAAVSVYESNDTLDIFTGKPYYFAITDEQGRFTIQNMRGGLYRMYAFSDANSNYLNEPSIEAHGFIADTLQIENLSDSLHFRLILQDVQEIKQVNTRANGSHFDVRYNKYLLDYSFNRLDPGTDSLASTLTSDNQVIRFYENDAVNDSIGYILSVKDSVGNSKTDTVFVKFTDRELNLSDMDIVLDPKSNSSITDQLNISITFSKPISAVNMDSLLLKYDTLKTVRVDSISELVWNWNKTKLTIDLLVEPEYLSNRVQELKLLQDSLIKLDSINGVIPDSTIQRPNYSQIKTNQLTFYSGRGSFISVENDSSELMTPLYDFKNPERFGKISGEIKIDSTYFIVQLINDKYELINQMINQKKYLFDYVPPGKYNIRVLVDSNRDGMWSYGNIKEGIMPEDIYFHSSFIELRENWEINNIDVTVE